MSAEVALLQRSLDAKKRCNQCWRMRLVKFFFKTNAPDFLKNGALYQDCIECRRDRRGPYRAKASRRRRIDAHPLRVLVAESGQNSKLGNIPATYTSGRTCPDSCTLKNAGCYAEFGFVRMHWQKMKGALEWKAFLAWVAALPAGQLWRHNVAGDLPGDGDKLDVSRFWKLADVAHRTRGFTFTHKPLDQSRFEANRVRAVNLLARLYGRGLVVNLSADSLAEADAKSELGIGPVVVTVPHDHPRHSKTPAGRRASGRRYHVREVPAVRERSADFDRGVPRARAVERKGRWQTTVAVDCEGRLTPVRGEMRRLYRRQLVRDAGKAGAFWPARVVATQGITYLWASGVRIPRSFRHLINKAWLP